MTSPSGGAQLELPWFKDLAAGAWEIAAKLRLDRLSGIVGLDQPFDRLVDDEGIAHLPIDHRHAVRVGALALAHRNPLDSALAAQAQVEGLMPVRRDPAMQGFDAPALW